MDQYELSKFAQLAVAHKCSVLYFTKDKFSTLGKKLRPEFERLYLSSEMKDCTKLLGKTIGEGSEPKNIVDLVGFCQLLSNLRLRILTSLHILRFLLITIQRLSGC